MMTMRTINVFKVKSGRVEYVDAIKAAVLDPRISGLKLHLNGGFDWIDQKYGFIKLLISRGQIKEIKTHQDLLACDDYINAIAVGGKYIKIEFDCTNAPSFGERNKKTVGYASDKRMRAAHQKFQSKLMIVSAS